LNETGEIRGGDETSIITERCTCDGVGEGGDFGGFGKGFGTEEEKRGGVSGDEGVRWSW
jgi:hypothetical protein